MGSLVASFLLGYRQKVCSAEVSWEVNLGRSVQDTAHHHTVVAAAAVAPIDFERGDKVAVVVLGVVAHWDEEDPIVVAGLTLDQEAGMVDHAVAEAAVRVVVDLVLEEHHETKEDPVPVEDSPAF